MKPLADKLRPKKIEDVVGQKDLLGEGKILNRIINSKNIPNMIFYGPPGVGKTTVANIIAETTDKELYRLNATNASIKDIRNITNNLDNLFNKKGVLLYLDEIQNFNKKQQQSLLEFTENGKITLIASTTENPYHYVYKAILSRSSIFEFKKVNKTEIIKNLKRSLSIIENDYKIKHYDELIEDIALISNGDVRNSINILELLINSSSMNKDGELLITKEDLKNVSLSKKINYDKSGDSHYNIISAFQKSIRGSDPDAALHYLARLIKADDLIIICRRLLVIAAEDIGLAYPNAMYITKSCTDAAKELGFPEAKIPLAEATILLATAPKSNSANTAINKALSDLESKEIGEIPKYLKDGHYDGAKDLGNSVGYKYPFNYEGNYVKQQYLPDNLKNEKYYNPQDNKFEKNLKNNSKKFK